MNIFYHINSILDSPLRIFVKTNNEIDYLKRRHNLKSFLNKENDNGAIDMHEMLIKELDVVDTKSSSLLTHLSIMLAVLAVIIETQMPEKKGDPVGDPEWLRLVIVFLVSYSMLALLLLRCVDVVGSFLRPLPEKYEDDLVYFLKEVQLRRSLFQIILRLVVIITLFFIGVFIIHHIRFIFN